MLPVQSDNRVFKLVGFVLLFVIIATIVFVFVKALVFDQPINDQALRQALLAASVGVTLSCLIAWVLDLLRIIQLKSGWCKLLRTVLVASILGSSAADYRPRYGIADRNIWSSSIGSLASRAHCLTNSFAFS